MKQAEIVAAIASGEAQFTWLELQPGVEVMAWPARINGAFVAVSARTALACADALRGDDWVVSLTTTQVEDLIYERAVARPEPVTLNPAKVNIASDSAIADHSQKLLQRIGSTAQDGLLACGKNWVQTKKLAQHPGRAANYGFFSKSAPYPSETGAYKLWQPLSFAHNLDHYDYSQMLRLVRCRPGTVLPSYEGGVAATPSGPSVPSVPSVPPTPSSPASAFTPSDSQASVSVAQGTLGERCLIWCLEEARTHEHPDAARIAWYHAIAMRNGKALGITVGNFCASAQSRALVECALASDVRPHEPRAGAIELQQDATRLGNWRSAAEVRARKWAPRPGDLAIYNRSTPTEAWLRHVDRVIRVSDDGLQYENIGANEGGGNWHREWSLFSNPKLLGFVVYPGVPLTESERASADVMIPHDAVG
ncbi:MAG: hypothetical protein ABW061_11840 [Polyangiaceae bacterium]